ncbi:hypothetical protein RZS28_04430 [Methylocapsa polymorpha]|uniref:Uncharacterized protein n=1 Tax=Methylocapsa polymorpha TaxID=3080828 RepID=A0ABZ0HTB8_9HYPH|nr:hypothetical protein RZS28_04430 [Methylocapsa sp. RX1]
MLKKTTSVFLVASALAMIATAASAETQARQHRQHRKPVTPVYYDEQPPLTVNKRSFLDPGPVVPVGSMSNYVTANTIFNRTPDQTFARSKYGNEELPWPLEVPGRPGPILEFETPAYPY